MLDAQLAWRVCQRLGAEDVSLCAKKAVVVGVGTDVRQGPLVLSQECSDLTETIKQEVNQDLQTRSLEVHLRHSRVFNNE